MDVPQVVVAQPFADSGQIRARDTDLQVLVCPPRLGFEFRRPAAGYPPRERRVGEYVARLCRRQSAMRPEDALEVLKRKFTVVCLRYLRVVHGAVTK
jgi:hypothetical protein